MRRLLDTPNDYMILIIRLTVAIVFFPHGAQKVFGWWGGAGFSTTMAAIGQQYGSVLAFLAIAAEFAGSLGLFVGLLGRIAALGLLANMVVAASAVHSRFGFFMNWGNNQQGEGFEFHLLAIAMLLVIVLRGSGALSIDRAIVTRNRPISK